MRVKLSWIHTTITVPIETCVKDRSLNLLAWFSIIEHSSFGRLFSLLLTLIYLLFLYDRQVKFFSDADFIKTCDSSKPRKNRKVRFSGRFTLCAHNLAH